MASVLNVLRNNLAVKKSVSDDVVRRWSEPGHAPGGLISIDWHRGYNKAIAELLEEIDVALNGEAIPELVRPRNLHSQSKLAHSDSLSGSS